MDQLLVGSADRLHLVIRDVDGNPVAPDVPGDVKATVTGVRHGAVFTDRPATQKGAGTFYVDVGAGDLTDPDLLTVTWTGITVDAADGTTVNSAEALGGVLVRTGEVAATLTTIPIDRITSAIAFVTDRIRNVLHWSHVPRLAVETVAADAFGDIDLDLTRRPVREIVSVVDDSDNAVSHQLIGYDVPQLSTYSGRKRLEVVYEYGADAVPHDLAVAAFDAARVIANQLHKQDPRRARIERGEDGVTFPISTVSARHGRPFGIDGVDDTIMAYNRTPLAG